MLGGEVMAAVGGDLRYMVRASGLKQCESNVHGRSRRGGAGEEERRGRKAGEVERRWQQWGVIKNAEMS